MMAVKKEKFIKISNKLFTTLNVFREELDNDPLFTFILLWYMNDDKSIVNNIELLSKKSYFEKFMKYELKFIIEDK